MADVEVAPEQLEMLKKAFGMFDQKKTGSIEVNKVAAILNTMGQQFDDDELQQLCTEKAKDGKLDFDSFVSIASNFLEEEDDEAMQAELKEAFRLYDKEGNGYITTQVLKEILKALDDKLTSEDLDGIIEEVDTDGSGTLDFDEFMEMMAGE
ncbi:troponin C, isoallergen Bla g 6.0101-like isoform X1 [Amphibalanus amphitrite]|uniref:troponin C, isoallergen Bla g 6.0101-like isoform X1 n=1 Tax=Amphibalanus amphitrite TaxID=1232801 RepID=UPI001C90C1CC|nr:troponin C, isoallergen Bla g 6.0101-like isoform X1 [Amphibalanus amphitrite]